MKKITSLALMLLFTITTFSQVNNYNVGDVVTDFTVTDIHGVEYNLYDLTAEGKYVYLDFFFTACGPCQDTAPTFNEFYDKYGCNDGDVFCISLNNGNDNNAAVEAYEQEHGGPFNHAPAVSNEGGAPAVDADFGIGAYPTYCLINPNNEIIELDIWVNNTITIEDLENTFPAGFDPEVMECFLATLDVDNTSDFILYPTISNGSNINLRLSNQVGAIKVIVFDITGKQVFSNDYNSSSIVFNLNVNAGTYFVQVHSDSKTTVKKLIIK